MKRSLKQERTLNGSESVIIVRVGTMSMMDSPSRSVSQVVTLSLPHLKVVHGNNLMYNPTSLSIKLLGANVYWTRQSSCPFSSHE